MKTKVGVNLRIIKRTKITIIRTETIFLKELNGEYAKDVRQIQSAGLLESEKDSVLEVEAEVKEIENRTNKGEVK